MSEEPTPRPGTDGADPVRVLYIAGAGRSGSTILARVLGELPGFCVTGEPYYVWQEGFHEDRRCGCGERFSECSFWSAVIAGLTAAAGEVDSGRFLALQGRVARTRHIPLLAIPPLRRRLLRRNPAYLPTLEKLYQSLRGVSGARVIIDGSKFPSYAVILGQSRAIDLSVVHLVRDSRAVAHSWSRRKHNPGSGRPFRRLGFVHTSLLWASWNAAIELLLARGAHRRRYMRLRYEDLVSAPAAVADRILAFMGESPSATSPIEGRWVTLHDRHTVAGNPSRFLSGRIELREDREWQRSMPRFARFVVSALTSPLLLRYGYFSSRGALPPPRDSPSA